MKHSVKDQFDLKDNVVVITGGAGLLGIQHAVAIAEAGGIPILWDINEKAAFKQAERIQKEFHVKSKGMKVDITNRDAVKKGLADIIAAFKRVNILINNAAIDPKVKPDQDSNWSRFENFALELWNKEIEVSLTGTFICSQIIGTYMARHEGGVILNIASDLGIIAPDQRIYRRPNLQDEKQPVKPVTYSVVKHGILGLTKYLATYWAEKGVRVNALCPGGVYTNQPDEFVKKLTNLIPMGRMANVDEYKGAIQFLCSDASSYMTGSCMVIDGGRSCW